MSSPHDTPEGRVRRARLENLAIGVIAGSVLTSLIVAVMSALRGTPSEGRAPTIPPQPLPLGLQAILMTIVVGVTLVTFWLAARSRRGTIAPHELASDLRDEPPKSERT